MKYCALGIVALLIGLVVGSLGWLGTPGAGEAAPTPVASAPANSEIIQAKSLLGVSTEEVRERASARAAGRQEASSSGAAAGPETTPVTRGIRRHQVGGTGTGTAANLDEAAALWNTRAALARNSVLTNLDAGPETAAAFDATVADMNGLLETAIADWAESVRDRDTLTGEDGIRLVNQLTGVMVATYEELDDQMPPGWRDQVGTGFELTAFVDPAVALPLVDMEDRIKDLRRTRRKRWLRPDGPLSPGAPGAPPAAGEGDGQ